MFRLGRWLTLAFLIVLLLAVWPGPAAADTPVSTLPAGSRLTGVWGSSASNVFIVGYDGADGALILHFDGSAWSIMSPGVSPHALNDVWGISPSASAQASSDSVQGPARTVGPDGALDVFAVGDFGTILHYDPAREAAGPGGTMWSPMSSGTSDQLVGVWGYRDAAQSPALEVFAVSNNGTILHYDPAREAAGPGGRVWSTMDNDTSGFLYDVWGSSGKDTVQKPVLDVFATSGHGTILHYAPARDTAQQAAVLGAAGPGGTAWSATSTGVSSNLLAVWGASASDVFAVGGNGTILHYDGRAWSPMNSGTQLKLDGIWGVQGDARTGGSVFAVGSLGTILRYDPAPAAAGPGGATWSAMKSGTTDRLTAVWGSSGSDVYAVGDAGTILHYDGQAWSVISGGASQ